MAETEVFGQPNRLPGAGDRDKGRHAPGRKDAKLRGQKQWEFGPEARPRPEQFIRLPKSIMRIDKMHDGIPIPGLGKKSDPKDQKCEQKDADGETRVGEIRADVG
jgi:hypothetical protein